MNNKEKKIISNLPVEVQELAEDMIESVNAKDAKKYVESASTFDFVFNRMQFDIQVMQAFSRFMLPKAIEAGVIQPPQQPTPQKPQTETDPNLVAEKVVGKAEVKAAESKKKAK